MHMCIYLAEVSKGLIRFLRAEWMSKSQKDIEMKPFGLNSNRQPKIIIGSQKY